MFPQTSWQKLSRQPRCLCAADYGVNPASRDAARTPPLAEISTVYLDEELFATALQPVPPDPDSYARTISSPSCVPPARSSVDPVANNRVPEMAKPTGKAYVAGVLSTSSHNSAPVFAARTCTRQSAYGAAESVPALPAIAMRSPQARITFAKSSWWLPSTCMLHMRAPVRSSYARTSQSQSLGSPKLHAAPPEPATNA